MVTKNETGIRTWVPISAGMAMRTFDLYLVAYHIFKNNTVATASLGIDLYSPWRKLSHLLGKISDVPVFTLRASVDLES